MGDPIKESLAPIRLPANLRNIQYEEAGNVTYIGVAAPGVLSSEPLWQIRRLTFSGPNFSLEHADGNAEYDNVWDNRAGLTYK